MRVGLPREIKDGEQRVALTPAGAAAMVQAGHAVVFEPGAGAGVGFADQAYARAGAAPGDAWACELVVKVKELQRAEYAKPRRRQTVFGFQHFGPEPALLEAALASGASFVAFETVGQASGLPILAPMSAIAGRLAVQVGAWCLQKPNGGSGVLLSGLEGVAPGKVTILGAGNVGANALAVAHGMGALVRVFARSEKRFTALRQRYPYAEFSTVTPDIADADLVIAGVLTPGQMSPKLITRAMLRAMRPGSALVDVGIDQGGIAETSRPTKHSAPIYIEEGIVHYCVPNMPAACARTASLALERAVLPFALKLAAGDTDSELETGVQVRDGKVVHAQLARDTGR
jgi:alanine dehydrogenase